MIVHRLCMVVALFLSTAFGGCGEKGAGGSRSDQISSKGSAFTINSARLVPWVFPFDDATAGITHFGERLNHSPAGSRGPLKISDDGHFQIAGKRIRFWGFNINGVSCFPSKDDAAAIAARLAKFGANIVRFHHLDHRWGGLSLIDYSKGGSRVFNEVALDRLDYFVSRLKAEGIYVNFNLLTAREFYPEDGLPADISTLTWKQRHVLGFVMPQVRALEKEHARNLLTHVNPYTQLKYADDPAIAIVEINNENGMLHQFLDGAIDIWPASAAGLLKAQWNHWLKVKYGTTADLKNAWVEAETPPGRELIKNNSFAEGFSRWNLETHGVARALAGAGSFGGERAAQINVQRPGTEPWHVQLTQSGVSLEKGQIYTVSFRAKSQTERPLSISIQKSQSPWNSFKHYQFRIGKRWGYYSRSFTSSVSRSDLRLTLAGFGGEPGQIHITDISLREGGTVEKLSAFESLEDQTIALNSTALEYSIARGHDWFEFLYSLEEDYWTDMKTFLEEDIGISGLPYGTISSLSLPSLQKKFKFIDAHGYWCHPVFPGKPWDSSDWSVCNRSMVSYPERNVLGDLAFQKHKGMPFTVSEYQHALPNSYAAEGPLLVAAYGSLQDWDGVYFFGYDVSSTGSWSENRFENHFQMNQHPALMANFAVGANLFRRHDVAPSRQLQTFSTDKETELDRASTQGGAWNTLGEWHEAFSSVRAFRFGVGLAGNDSGPADTALSGQALTHLRSDTDELVWKSPARNRSHVTVNTANTKAVIGFTAGQVYQLGDVSLEFGSLAQGWATIAATTQSGSFANLDQETTILVVATGLVENTGMKWVNPERTQLADGWGTAPTRVEIVPFKLTLPVDAGRVNAWSLTETGARKQPLVVVPLDRGASISADLAGGSLWYEIRIEASH